MRIISDAGLNLLEQCEGLRFVAYLDSAGVPTIGYGHTGPEVHIGQTCTLAEAEALLEKDLVTAEKAVNDSVKVTINQNQFDALVVFTYNVGVGGLHASNLLRDINLGKTPQECAPMFLHFVTAGGKHDEGLVNRRNKEIKLFLS